VNGIGKAVDFVHLTRTRQQHHTTGDSAVKCHFVSEREISAQLFLGFTLEVSSDKVRYMKSCFIYLFTHILVNLC